MEDIDNFNDNQAAELDEQTKQTKEYIQNIIDGLSLDEYDDMAAFLSDYLGSDTTLKAMIDGINTQIAIKVDKVEGKSLIDAEYASSQSTQDNLEFLSVTIDEENEIEAIALTEVIDSGTYTTYIYYYDGYLRELFVSSDAVYTAKSGQPIVEIGNLSINDSTTNSVSLTLTSTKGTKTTMFLSTKSS